MRPAGDSGEEALIVEEMTPLPPATGSALSSGETDLQPLDDVHDAAETTGSAGWQPADQAADDGSGDTDFAQTEAAEAAAYVAPSARASGPSLSRPDDDDPSSEHS